RRINYSHAYLFSGVYYHSFLIIFFYFPPMFFFQIIPPLLSPPLFPYTTLFRSVDPLEEGMDPPEHWSEADAYGTAPVEQQQGESIQQRVAEDRGDFDTAEPAPEPRPTTAGTPLDELDESADNAPNQSESLVAEQPPADPSPDALEWQNADEAGGSIADEVREPESPQ